MSGGGVFRDARTEFLIFTEDSARSAVSTISSLSKILFQYIVPGLNVDLINFSPPESRLRSALSGNAWKSKEPRDQRKITDLVRTIANQLATPHGFVIFHFDGDVAYAQKRNSENLRKFEELIIDKVYLLLLGQSSTGKRDPDEARALLSKLLVLTPYYCFEAWAYYNNSTLRSKCCDADIPRLDSWEEHPELIEELDRPWSYVSAGKDHNLELVEQGFPIHVAIAAQKSFNEAVEMLKSTEKLMSALSPLVFSWLRSQR